MESFFKLLDEGYVTAPKGFRAGGVFCDIKRLGTGKGSSKGQKRDLAILFSEKDAAVAGMFTTNQVSAAPVKVCIRRISAGVARAVVANSGNANACTGEQGIQDALHMSELTAELLGVNPEKVFVCSTGRIGIQMPIENVANGIRAAIAEAGSEPEFAHHAAEAIMTSDNVKKEVAVEFVLNEKTVRIAGMCKGAGMIQPGMSPNGKRPASMPSTPGQLHATMLGFLTTDVAIKPDVLQVALQEAVACSFNRISVDGDMSTNDTVLAFANGMAGNTIIDSTESDSFKIFCDALVHVCLLLAQKMVHDGEGVSRFITLKLEGAETPEDADVAVRAVANSALVKTSWCGGDPNWGRVLDALGYSAAHVDENKVDLAYSLPADSRIIYVLKGGQPVNVSLSEVQKITMQKEFDLHIFLNLGSCSTKFFTADITEKYVDFNKGE